METDFVVYFSCSKTIFISGVFENLFRLVKQVFVYKVPHLNKRIQHRLDRGRLDWTNRPGGTRLHSGGESPELKVEWAITLAATVLSYHVC